MTRWALPARKRRRSNTNRDGTSRNENGLQNMKKMTDEDLLDILQRHENSAATYVHGQLGTERELSMREYHRLPYGNEEDGWSHIVASDIQDTVEWTIPVLLKIFSGNFKFVSYDRPGESDVKGA